MIFKPVQRIDHHDAVYKTKKEKYRAVVEEVKKAHEKGQPVLVGTINIDTSELLSGMLKREGIPHTVLNAKFHELEAEIVAGAGQHGAVTIATNMAGRGTDIKHLVLDLFIFRNTKCIEHIHQFIRAKESHQIIFK